LFENLKKLNQNESIHQNSLEKRNEEIKKAQIEYYKNLPDPDCPPGHRKLPSNEKEETLNKLKESKAYILKCKQFYSI